MTSRTRLMIGFAAAALTALTTFAATAQETLKIGYIDPLSGGGASIGQTHTGRLEHRALQVQHRLLRHICDAQTGLGLQRAVVRLFQCRQYLQQRGLARPVAPDQANPFLGLKRKVGVIKQRDVTKGQLRVLQGDECHGGARVKGVAIIPVRSKRCVPTWVLSTE